jgi:hypothetical protein
MQAGRGKTGDRPRFLPQTKKPAANWRAFSFSSLPGKS